MLYVVSIVIKQQRIIAMTVTPNDSCWFSYNQQIDSLFYSLLRLIKKKINNFRITGPLWGEPAVTGGSPQTKAN